MGKARVVFHLDPTGQQSPQVDVVTEGTCVRDVIRNRGRDESFTCISMDGAEVPPWYEVQPGDTVSVHVLPGDPVTVAISTFLTTYIGSQAAGYVAVAVVNAAIGLAVNVIINALYRPDKPSSQKGGVQSTVYSVGAIENGVRTGESVQVGYGTFLMTPPLAAQPYVRYDSNDQYLYSMYCVGIGDYDISRIYLADADENEIGGDAVEYEVYRPDAYTRWVQRDSGLNLEGVFGNIQSQSSLDFDENVFTSPLVGEVELTTPRGYSSQEVYDFTANVRFDTDGRVRFYRPPPEIAMSIPEMKYMEFSRGNFRAGVANTGRWTQNQTPGRATGNNYVRTATVYTANKYKADNPGTRVSGYYVDCTIEGSEQVIEIREPDMGRKGIHIGDVIRFRGKRWIAQGVYTTRHTLRIRLRKVYPSQGLYSSGGIHEIQVIGRRIRVISYGSGAATRTPFYPVWRSTFLPRKIELDFVMPSGSYTLKSTGSTRSLDVYYKIEVRLENSEDVIWSKRYRNDGSGRSGSSWRTRNALRWTIKIGSNVKDDTGRTIGANGKWEVSVSRSKNYEQYEMGADKLLWVGVRGVDSGLNLDGTTRDTDVYAGTTMVVARIKATRGVSSAAQRQLRVQASRILQPATSTEQNSGHPGNPPSDYQITRNPMDAFADILTASYGGKFDRSILHQGSISEVRQVAHDNSLWFDGVFDTSITITDALKSVTQVVPATPIPYQAQFGVVRMKEIPDDQYLYSDYNTLEGSVQYGYSFKEEGDYDGVEVEYRDFDRFTPKVVTAGKTGVDARVDRITLFGCTDEGRATQYAEYWWTRLVSQRRTVSFSVSSDGHLPMFGDRIRTHFEEFDHGVSAMVSGVYQMGDGRWLVSLDNAPGDGKTHYRIRSRTAEPSALTPVNWAGSIDIANLGLEGSNIRLMDVTATGVVPVMGDSILVFINGEYTGDAGDSWIVTALKPTGGIEGTVTIEGINYNKTIYKIDGMKD